jgi:hypothetical protein
VTLLMDVGFEREFSGTHAGGNIGGVAPTIPYLPLVLPNGALLSTIQSAPNTAGQYPTVMTYYARQLLAPKGGQAVMSFDAWFDESYLTSANAFETDLLPVFPGATPLTNLKVNNSLQNVAGQLWLTMAGVWVKIPGAVPGLFVPGKRYHHEIKHQFTPASGAILSVAINDQTFAVPSTMQKSDVAEVNWTALMANVQVQQSLVPKGTSYSVMIENLTLAWQPLPG